MVIGDLEVTRRQMCCCHSFLFPVSVSFISKVRGEVCTCGSLVAKCKCEGGAHLGLSCALRCLCACLLCFLHAS